MSSVSDPTLIADYSTPILQTLSVLSFISAIQTRGTALMI